MSVTVVLVSRLALAAFVRSQVQISEVLYSKQKISYFPHNKFGGHRSHPQSTCPRSPQGSPSSMLHHPRRSLWNVHFVSWCGCLVGYPPRSLPVLGRRARLRGGTHQAARVHAPVLGLSTPWSNSLAMQPFQETSRTPHQS